VRHDPGHVRKTMNPGGRLLIVEIVLPRVTQHIRANGRYGYACGGRRSGATEAEYGLLLSKAGFHLTLWCQPMQQPASWKQ